MKQERTYLVVREDDRYGMTAQDLPRLIVAYGSLEQAEVLAERLSNWYAGCDGVFHVAECENCGHRLAAESEV